MAILIAFVFVIGLIIGSFLNVVILRGGRGERLGGRSYCEACRRQLSPLELIPVLSYVLQRGRCRRCGAAFSVQHPLVELATALSFVAAFYLFLPRFSQAWSIFFFLLILAGVASAIVIFVQDLRYKIIPNGSVFVLFLVGVAAHAERANFFYDKSIFWRDVGFSFFFSVFFGLLWLVSGGKWMGLGDAKLIFATSLVLGYPASIAAFLFSFWLGCLGGIIFFFFRGRKLKSEIPFGPFILSGSALAFFFAPAFLSSSGLGLFIPIPI